ncbi:MAG: hypothetical protein V7K40_33845 [Nostoc sp.]
MLRKHFATLKEWMKAIASPQQEKRKAIQPYMKTSLPEATPTRTK